MHSNLALRLSTAVVGLPIVIGLAYLGGWPFAIAAGIVVFLAAVEFQHGWLVPSMPLAAGHIQQFMPTALACACIVTLSLRGTPIVWLGISLAAILAVIGYSQTNMFGPRRPFRVMSWCIAYLGVLGASLVLLRDLPWGRDWFFIMILSTFATDTGAYAVGRMVGHTPLAPKISPKKTREGAVGGLAAGILAVLLLELAFDTVATSAKIAPLAIVLPVAGQVGDLFESWMKRRMGVKDASGLLPGHGGFMDRLDSVLFVMPLAYLYVRFVIL